MKKILCLIIITAFLTYSCKDKNYVEATIIEWPGACEYLIQVGSTLYSPLNLPEKFKINNLKVQVDFKAEGNSVTCYIDSNFDTIKINKIKKR